MFSKALAILAFLLLPLAANATTYYVDFSGGSNSANGTSTATAWKNIPGTRTADNTGYLTAPGWVTLNAGDIVKIKSGTTHSSATGGRIVIDSTYYGNGTAGSPIVIMRDTGWGSGAVTIDGTGITVPSWASLIDIARRNYITIDGVTTDGLLVQNSARLGLQANGNTEAAKVVGLTVKNLKLYNSAWFNLFLQTCSNFTIDNVTIDGNSVNGTASGGFHIGGEGQGCTTGTVSNCRSYNNGSPAGSIAGGTDASQGFWLTNSTDVTFINDVAYNNAGRGFDTGTVGNNPTIVTNNVKFINCTSYNNSNGFGVNLDDITGVAKFYYVNCIAHHNTGAGFDIYEGVTVSIYNSLAAYNHTGFYIDAPTQTNRTTSVTIKNTILYKNTVADMDVFRIAGLLNNTIVSDYNHWEYGSQTMAVYWNDVAVYDPYVYDTTNAPGKDTRNYFVNHALDGNSTCSVDNEHAAFISDSTPDWHLRATSNLIGKGVVVVDAALPEVVYDMDGTLRGATWDIGPYQYSSLVPVPADSLFGFKANANCLFK